ncbi:hypothetical protein LPB142_11950 [Rhodobacter xanthinilyticus]|uniref:Uncharacterized protein n=1 Tax=Rhodobacter xanthinilyticus TaxID=1850250 RepID=A0A1D9MDY5_9RHOB|nr:hypothetical protein [Rhodobacter xanthinilyticus]AOZ69949.1 hypothetical protein LPB142_11950 [Rhodobacter xanthinilyticus]
MNTTSQAFSTAAIALADHLDDTARANRIGPQRFYAMNSLRTAADALYYAAEMIADGRKLDDPEVALHRRVAEHHMGIVSAS